MRLDSQGHVHVSPREICEGLDQSARLINRALIPGTPLAFTTYELYCDFLDACADAFSVHPRNILVRGSAKTGFSLSPDPSAAWVAMHPGSDLDLAIVDPDYYHYLDREIRIWERKTLNQDFKGAKFKKSVSRRKHRGFYTYRYFDLPSIACVRDHNARVKSLPVEACCGVPRSVDAFIFRDWWSLYSRWEFDLQALKRSLARGLERGGDTPRPFEV